MYDRTTRSTYADLFKTAEAQMPQRLRAALVKTAQAHDAVHSPSSEEPANSASTVSSDARGSSNRETP